MAQRIYHLLPLLWALGLLAQSTLFVNSYYTQLFVFLIVGCVTAGMAGFLMYLRGSYPVSALPVGCLALLALWAGYIYVTGHTAGSVQSFYWAASLGICLVLACCTVGHPWAPMCHGLLAVAALQALYCLLQWLGGNHGQGATGSWGNPNVTAMYLALALPLAWRGAFTAGKRLAWYRALLLLLAAALWVLNSRTAWLGAATGSLLMLEWRYGLATRWLAKLPVWGRPLAALLILGLLYGGGTVLYRAKKESADGRWFIWQLTAQMVSQKPLLGHGHGSFEKNYNLWQAAYFTAHGGTAQQRRNAAHVNTAYNEFLQTAAEGGLVGLALLIGLLALLLLTAYRQLQRGRGFYYTATATGPPYLAAAAVGLLVFIVMSLVNFTLLAVPVMALWVVYAAYIVHTALCANQTVGPGQKPARAMGLACMGLATLLGLCSIRLAAKQMAIKKAVTLDMAGQYALALQALPRPTGPLADYWFALGNIHYRNGNKAAAAMAYQQAAAHISTPVLYQQWGNCCLALGQYPQAIAHYQTALHIQPHRFTPRYLLLLLYLQIKDAPRAAGQAQAIVDMEAKVPSELIDRYKKTAQQILQQLKTNH